MATQIVIPHTTKGKTMQTKGTESPIYIPINTETE